MEWRVKSNLIQYIIPIHVGLWYGKWGGCRPLSGGVHLNVIQYIIPIHVEWWYDRWVWGGRRRVVGLGVESEVKPNLIHNSNTCRVVV